MTDERKPVIFHVMDGKVKRWGACLPVTVVSESCWRVIGSRSGELGEWLDNSETAADAIHACFVKPVIETRSELR